MEALVLAARWPGLLLFSLGGLLLAWRLLAPELEPRQMLRWGRGRVEQAMVQMVGPVAAPAVAGAALAAGGVTLALGGVLLVLALGPLGLLVAPFLALWAGQGVAGRLAGRRMERLSEQVRGLTQALSAGLSGRGVGSGTVFTLLRRYYHTLEAPLREELAFLELVMRGQAELGERLERAAGSAAHRHLRALLELLSLIYREALDAAAQRQAFRTLLQRFEQDERVRRTVQVESRFGRTSQAIVLGMIPAFVALSALVGSSLGSEVSTLDFYFGTLPGRAIVVAVLVVEGLVVLLSRRMVRQIRWD
jgi:hypothetical protein